jgi:hypothetical protein
MLFDVYDLERPAYSSLPPFFGYRFSVEAAGVVDLGVGTGRAMRAERGRGRGIAWEGPWNERIRIRGAGVGVREEE